MRECPRVAVGISHFKGLCRAGSEPRSESGLGRGLSWGLSRRLSRRQSRRLSRGLSRGPRGRSVGYHLVGYAGEYRIELIENGLPVIGFPEHNEHGVISCDCSGHRLSPRLGPRLSPRLSPRPSPAQPLKMTNIHGNPRALPHSSGTPGTPGHSRTVRALPELPSE